jgi:outer membrane lipoprotein-sorting protein
MAIKRVLSIFFTLLTLLFFSRAVICQTDAVTAQSIVEKMGAQYANASSYQDTGVVLEGTSREPVLQFKTYFVRPQLFRFEWTDRSPVNSEEQFNVVWSDGKQTQRYYSWDDSPVEKEEDIGFGIAGATGISRGAAHTVPSLLMEEVGGLRLTELTKLSLAGEETLAGEDCYIVRGFNRDGTPTDMWISKRDFLLRQLKQTYSDGAVAFDVRRDVKFNAPIPPETFSFTPPPPKPKTRARVCGLAFLPIALIGYLALVRPRKRSHTY